MSAWKYDCPYCPYRQGREEKKQRGMLVSVAGVPSCMAPDPDPEPGRSTAFRFTLREIYRIDTRWIRRRRWRGCEAVRKERGCDRRKRGQFVVGHRPGKERRLRRSYDGLEIYEGRADMSSARPPGSCRIHGDFHRLPLHPNTKSCTRQHAILFFSHARDMFRPALNNAANPASESCSRTTQAAHAPTL
jgi:hypothetical protein